MSDQDGGTEKHGLMIVALTVLLVVSGVIGLGISKARHTTIAAAPPMAQVEAPTSVGQVRFAPGQDSLPFDAQDALGRISSTARSNPGAVVVLSGAFNGGNDAAAHQELAQRRLQQVRHALEANGVSPQQLITAKPMALPAGSPAAQVDQVEMRLQ